MARQLILGGALLAWGTLFTVPASAAPATVVHGSVTFPAQSFDDSDVCAAQGFTVHVVEHEKLLFNLGLDAAGQFAALFAHPRHRLRDLREGPDDR